MNSHFVILNPMNHYILVASASIMEIPTFDGLSIMKQLNSHFVVIDRIRQWVSIRILSI